MSYFNTGSSQRLPPAVKNIIIINVIMVFATLSLFRMNINLDDYLALHYWASPDFKWWQLLTHMFMHGSPDNLGLTFEHIFFNMFGLWMFGGLLERIWGPGRFLIFYLICGFGAALCHMGILTIEFNSFHHAFVAYQQHPGYDAFLRFLSEHDLSTESKFVQQWAADKGSVALTSESIELINRFYLDMTRNTSMVGASGAIFGVLFAFAYLFPNTELYIMFIPIPVKAKWAVTGYAVIELFSGIGHIKGDNVAHFAHLGGMLFAFILLSIWQKNNRKEFY